jgi:hypothetical protein
MAATLASVVVAGAMSVVVGSATAAGMAQQYIGQARSLLRSEADSAIKVSAAKIESENVYLDRVGDCSLMYGEYDATLGARLVTADCRKSENAKVFAKLQRYVPCEPCALGETGEVQTCYAIPELNQTCVTLEEYNNYYQL